MSISAQNSYPSIKTDLRQGNRRSSDIEQQAYAAVGRRFAADDGPFGKGRIVRVVLAGTASIMVVTLVTVLALLSYENINTAHARKVASVEPPATQAVGMPPAHESKPAKPARPVVIIDEKDDAPLRAAPAPAPVPALVLLSPAEHGAAQAPAARPVPLDTAPRPREHARAATPAGKRPVSTAARPAHPPTARNEVRKGGRNGVRKELRNDVRNAVRKTVPPVKRKAHLASMAAPAQQGASGSALGTLLSYASVQRRYLAQPLPLLASRMKAARRRHLAEP